MKKRLFTLFTIMMMAICFITPAYAYESFGITVNPSSGAFRANGSAKYTVEAYGPNIKYEWHIVYNGTDYAVGESLQAQTEPDWYTKTAGTYGHDTATFWIYGVSADLNGAEVYCRVRNGEFYINSSKAVVIIDNNVKGNPPYANVPSSMLVEEGTPLDSYCYATTNNDATISDYLWYETTTYKLNDIIAINKGSETYHTLHVDTSKPGTRHFVCMVTDSNGEYTYSGVTTVTVVPKGDLDNPYNNPILTLLTEEQLPAATVGKPYEYKIDCTQPDAEFSIFWDTDNNINQFGDTNLDLSLMGYLTGTPKKAGTFSFYVAVDWDGYTSWKMYTLKVNPAETKPQSPSPSPSPVSLKPPVTEAKTTLEIGKQPEDVEVAEGEKAVFECEGKGAEEYQWYVADTPQTKIKDATKLETEGADTGTLTITASKDYDGKYFVCTLTSKEGTTIQSDYALLTVKENQNAEPTTEPAAPTTTASSTPVWVIVLITVLVVIAVEMGILIMKKSGKKEPDSTEKKE